MMMPRPTFTFPSWFPGFLSYSSLLVINAILPVIAVFTLDDVAIGLSVTLIACNTSACVVLLAMLSYKIFMRSCVFNDIKRDRRALFCVALLDFCAAIGWSIRLDRNRLCTGPSGSTIPCHIALIAAGLVLAWFSLLISYCAAMCADRGGKKRKHKPSPLPIDLSRPVVSSPVLVYAGQFSESEDSKYINFTDIPLRPNLGAGDV